MRVAIEAASLALTSGGLARYTSELSLALAHAYPDDEFYLTSDQPFPMPPDAAAKPPARQAGRATRSNAAGGSGASRANSAACRPI